MAKKVGRVIHLANLPLALITPPSRVNITEVAFRTVPSASKVEIRNVLEAVYGLRVHKVCTINMEGKKKMNRRLRCFIRRPDYKKAYVVLKEPVTLPANLFPFSAQTDAKKALESKLEAKVAVEAESREAEKREDKVAAWDSKANRQADSNKSRVKSKSQYPKFSVNPGWR